MSVLNEDIIRQGLRPRQVKFAKRLLKNEVKLL